MSEKAWKIVLDKMPWIDEGVIKKAKTLHEKNRKKYISDAFSGALLGSHDATWLSFHAAMERIGAESMDKVRGVDQVSRNSGWWFPYQEAVVFSDRPCTIKFDEQDRFHCEDGPSIAYTDGFAYYYFHGVEVPAEWVEERDTIDPSIILKAENVEQRAAGMNIIGWPRALKVLKQKVIDDSGDPVIGQLIELQLPGLPEPGRFLKAECPRNGTIVEGVPRVSDIDNKPIETALAAQAWRVGDPQSEYEHPPRRT